MWQDAGYARHGWGGIDAPSVSLGSLARAAGPVGAGGGVSSPARMVTLRPLVDRPRMEEEEEVALEEVARAGGAAATVRALRAQVVIAAILNLGVLLMWGCAGVVGNSLGLCAELTRGRFVEWTRDVDVRVDVKRRQRGWRRGRKWGRENKWTYVE